RGSHTGMLPRDRGATAPFHDSREPLIAPLLHQPPPTSTNLHRPSPTSTTFFSQSHRSDLNRRPLDYESRALPLSYGGVRSPNLARCCSARYSTCMASPGRRCENVQMILLYGHA